MGWYLEAVSRGYRSGLPRAPDYMLVGNSGYQDLEGGYLEVHDGLFVRLLLWTMPCFDYRIGI